MRFRAPSRESFVIFIKGRYEVGPLQTLFPGVLEHRMAMFARSPTLENPHPAISLGQFKPHHAHA